MEDIYGLTDSLIQKRIGEKIKAARLRQNITQDSLAEASMLSRSSVQKIEAGEIGSFDSFIRILRTLGLLDKLSNLCEEDRLSPNEYYNMVHSLKRTARKRATHNVTHNLKPLNDESEW